MACGFGLDGSNLRILQENLRKAIGSLDLSVVRDFNGADGFFLPGKMYLYSRNHLVLGRTFPRFLSYPDKPVYIDSTGSARIAVGKTFAGPRTQFGRRSRTTCGDVHAGIHTPILVLGKPRWVTGPRAREILMLDYSISGDPIQDSRAPLTPSELNPRTMERLLSHHRWYTVKAIINGKVGHILLNANDPPQSGFRRIET